MTSSDEPAPRRVWSAELDGTPYELSLESGRIAISYYSPPEYHYKLSDNCSLSEFVAGKINGSVRQLFGQPVLDEALAIARAQIVLARPR